jgi:hypothetical protein
MTEAEWLACTDPVPVWEFLRARASERKLRLHAAACCRRIWHLLADTRSRSAVEVAERLADGQASGAEAKAAGGAAEKAYRRHPGDFANDDFAALAALAVCRPEAWRAADFAATSAAYALAAHSGGDGIEGALAAAASVVRLRRLDIFGNPFRPAALSPSWLTPDVLGLARDAYEERTLPAGTLEPERLALLADALEDAGCDNKDVLDHLRSPGPHARGCWAVDLLSGRK